MTDPPVLAVRRRVATDADVGAAWRRLQACGNVGTPFLTWEWVSSLAGVPDVSAGMEVLVAEHSGRIVGLLPVLPLGNAGPLRALGLAPTWLGADHLDVVAEAEHRTAVAHAFVCHLASWSAWQVLDLDGLDPSGALAGQVPGLLRPLRFIARQPVATEVPYVSLRESDAWRRTNAMKEAARKARGAQRAGGGFSMVATPDRVVELLEQLMDLHNRRMGARSAVFATPSRREFHLLAAHRMAQAGLARVYRLAADGVNAGLQYDLVLGDRMFFYQSGIEPGSARSPGLTVLGQAIGAAAEEGFREFDLLRGDEPYKQRFATDVRTNLRLRVVRLTPRVALHAGARLAGRAARQLPRRPVAVTPGGRP
jgi:CelD/BcsL family acetyltransferase involved in cellulose biosynthesis